MCDQDKAFSEAYDKSYLSKKVKDLAKKTVKLVDKFSKT